ncbi:MAG TPA: hypothetical protein VNZ49_02325 [Bacteroidia bacterium]|nr:hypothetical protein [Bacteroidia bacterium]
MKPESTKFPQYRKYKNGLSYFKILSFTEFEEVRVIGKKRIVDKITAKQYPEKVFISDLLFNYEDFAEEIQETEYENKYN